ncbi:hypothetical protein KUL72_06880 [Bradyrhizobium arachidis]|uniref:DUF5681 domain-containing protein n=1 Tax=Bradyrhizobium arachidis TaxID=858423 RepID=UPI00216114EE|nr:DUF5681 domain-containing protein [Bradyrhizobium arachidis]UVO38095.1 hypothetical protein KUL72_06880 [Bradyrhizobium arachidis]
MTKTAGKQRGRPFARGVSGNVLGRPRGSKNRATVLLAAISEADASAIQKTVVHRAKKGDMVAVRIILDRIFPAPKGRLVSFALPEIEDAAGILSAHAAVLAAATAGILTVEEAAHIAQALARHLEMIETVQLESRLRQVEEQLAHATAQEPQ